MKINVAELEQDLIKKARNSPYWFIYYLSGLKPAAHHVEWLTHIFNFDKNSKDYRVNIIAPRESGKSVISLYSQLWFQGRMPYKTNLLVSVSAAQAETRLNMLKTIIQYNPRFRNVFPNITLDINERSTVTEYSLAADGLYNPNENKFVKLSYEQFRLLRQRHGSLKDPTMYATGVGGKGVIGRRISGVMIMDDIIDENMLKAEIQEQVYNYIMTTLIPLLQADAKAINIGTRWMIDDVPERLQKNPEWTTLFRRSLTADPDTGKLESYWPEYWSVERLLKRKAEMNSDALFEIAYQNNPRAFAASRVTEAQISVPLPAALPERLQIYIGTDFAISLKRRADYTVFAAVGVDSEQNVYLLDMLRIKAAPEDITKQLGLFTSNILSNYGKINRVLVEKVGFQTWAKTIFNEKLPYLVFADVPLVGDKGDRLERLAQKAANGKFFINTKMPTFPIFVQEVINFPLFRNDDTIDAVTVVLQYLDQSVVSSKVIRVKPRSI